MYGRSCCCLLILLFATLTPVLVRAQSSAPDRAADFALPAEPRLQPEPPVRFSPPKFVNSPHLYGLPQLAAAAGTIFSGTVTEIAHRPATNGQPVETVAITFHVENAIRGATPGETFTISQWIGLWAGGQRYRVGERLLLFLYPPSKLGLSSAVGGSLGRFALDSRGGVLFSAQHLSAFRTDPVLGGRSHVRFSDFASAVRQASGEE